MTTRPPLTEHAKRFIKAHRSSSSNEEVARKMETTPKMARNYASLLRMRGVDLKFFQPGRRKKETTQ